MKHGRRKGPPDIIRLEAKQGRCPEGHLLPHKSNKGRCTPVFCAGSNAPADEGEEAASVSEADLPPKLGSLLRESKRQVLLEVSRVADEFIDKMIPGETIQAQAGRAAAKAQKADELQKLAMNIGRYAAMRTYFKVPEGLAGAEAEEYVKRRAEILSVDAITDLERDLKLGDDHQRREARRDLLDMAGLRKRESVQGGGSVIMLVNQVGGGMPLTGVPLIQRKLHAPQTVDATSSSSSGTPAPERPPGPKGDD